MQIRLTQEPLEALSADAVVALVFSPEEGESVDPAIDAWSGGLLAEMNASGEMKGKPCSTALVHRPGGLAAKRLLLVGAGPRAKFSAATLRRLAAAAARALKPKGVRSLAFTGVAGVEPSPAAQAIVEGIEMGVFEVGVYKTEGRAEGSIDELILALPADAQAGVDRGVAVARGQQCARALANEPANRLTPTVLAERARELAAETGLEIEVFDRAQLQQMGAGALLGVAQGSAEPPVMIVLRYRPAEAPASDVHLGLIGKAVTFDTGGISIKPSADMDRMKYDMAGGAAVLGAMRALADLKPPIPVTAVVPSVENMPGGKAMRPGDVVTTLSGKTVEVLNTDAEGRLILCDAIDWARKQGCNRLVDAATLTGAIVVALGYERSGLFANDDAWRDAFLAAADVAGEKYWPMPLDDEYKELLDSGIADLPNIGSRWGGAVTAAKFLQAFADPTPWVHLDIAGTAWLEAPKPEMPKGPTGVGVRTMVELAMRL
jgi:leucyl aminopeptidase